LLAALVVQLKYLVRANAGATVLMTTVHTKATDTIARSVDFLVMLILMS
jgi:hypothetical protein